MTGYGIKHTGAGMRGLIHKYFTPSLLVWLLPVFLAVPNVALCFTEFNSVWAKIANVLLPFGVYLFLASLSRRIGRTTLFCIPLMVYAAFQIVLLFLYGGNIIAIDMFMNVLTTNATEVGELLGNLKWAILTVIVIYLPLIGIAIWFCVKKLLASNIVCDMARRLSVLFMIAGVVFVILAYAFADAFNPRRELFPYNVIENMVTAIVRSVQSSYYPETSAAYAYNARSERPDSVPEVYVLVIGETSRADNWQLFGYGRETTPQLAKRQNIVAFSKTLSEINTTHKSVPMLMSPLMATTFGDSVNLVKPIFAAFDDSGYRTAFISNQRRNRGYIDMYGEQAGTGKFLSDGGGPQDDMNLVAELRGQLDSADGGKVFVVLHTYGSHFEYNKRYPSAYSRFKPDSRAEASRSNRDELINAYDNTILYTDAVLDSIITTLEQRQVPAAMLYVSDHGEDIFDDDRGRFLHASPVPTYWQLHVPLLVWTSPQYAQAHPERVDAMRRNAGRNVASSQAVFHTLLDLAGIQTHVFNATRSLASDSYAEPKRYYLNDYNEAVPLRDSGLRPQDMKPLLRTGISTE